MTWVVLAVNLGEEIEGWSTAPPDHQLSGISSFSFLLQLVLFQRCVICTLLRVMATSWGKERKKAGCFHYKWPVDDEEKKLVSLFTFISDAA